MIIIEQQQYSITQVSKTLNIKDSTLRKWESDYDLNIPRNELGHRFYTDKEIEVLKQIVKLKDSGANIHVIKRILDRSVEAIEQKEQALELVTLDKLTAADLKEVMLKQFSEIMLQREEELTRRYEEKLEQVKNEIREEIRLEFEKQQEQRAVENQKLLDYIENTRQKNIPWWNIVAKMRSKKLE